MLKAASLADVVLLAMLTGVVWASPAGDAGWSSLAVAGGLCLLALSPWLEVPVAPGKLRPDRVLVLLAVMLLAARVRTDPTIGPEGWWPLVVAGSGLLAGIGLSIRAWSADRWTAGRGELILSAGVALLVAGFVVAAAWGILALRSTADMSPGAVGYLDDLAVWAAWWFCFDARFRALPEVADRGALGWWRDRWPAVVGLLAAALTTLHVFLI